LSWLEATKGHLHISGISSGPPAILTSSPAASGKATAATEPAASLPPTERQRLSAECEALRHLDQLLRPADTLLYTTTGCSAAAATTANTAVRLHALGLSPRQRAGGSAPPSAADLRQAAKALSAVQDALQTYKDAAAAAEKHAVAAARLHAPAIAMARRRRAAA
jgi:hypothetical protein